MNTKENTSLRPMRTAILGLGTVGGGVYDVLTRNNTEISRRAFRPIEIVAVADINVGRAKEVTKGNVRIVSDAFDLVTDPDIDVIVELIGGTTIAKNLVLEAIKNGKHVITANKALLAKHGNEIFQAAQEKGVIISFEAAVAGGIPIIKALREGLTANRINWIAGIVNGTSNYILTEMRNKGVAFDTALADAQRLGYAEADPTFDIEGIDAAHKLTIMSALAFGIPVAFDKVYIEGISHLTQQDIKYADEFGYRIKLLAITKRRSEGIELRVHPTLIPKRQLIANVDGVMNAVIVNGDAVGSTLYYGAGAGAQPTASAVIADLVDMTRNLTVDAAFHVPYQAFQPNAVQAIPILPIDEIETSYYLRMRLDDRPGALADAARILADNNISIEAMIQKEAQHGVNEVDVIFLTHRAIEKNVCNAIKEIEKLDISSSPVVFIRMEALYK